MERHRSLRNLAALCGVPLTRLAALEDGRLDPDLPLLDALAQGLGVARPEIFRRAQQLAATDHDGPAKPEAFTRPDAAGEG